MSEVHVTGLADLQKLLDTLPAKLEANVMRGALRAGANVIKEQAKVNVPVGKPGTRNAERYGAYAGALRDSIRVGARIKGGTVTAYIKAGGKTKGGADAYYATMVEFGTKPHYITINGSGKEAGRANYRSLVIGGQFVGPYVAHPGARSRPFMRPAMDAKATEAVVAAAEYMKKRLATKEGLDTAEINIEVEV